MDKLNRIDDSMKYTEEWNRYLRSLSHDYGEPTKLIWISKRRKKYVLEFEKTQTLVINDDVYKFNEILSCGIENALPMQVGAFKTTKPYILLVRTSNRTNLLVALTVWGMSQAYAIYELIQDIIKSKVLSE